MAAGDAGTTYTESLLESIDSHLKVIRKYAAWIEFVVVLTFALSIVGVVVAVMQVSSDSNNPTLDQFCQDNPTFC
jgi:hypothetical protein